MIDDLLLQVHKPARYIGEEWNISRKDFHAAEIKFALCFSDLYEVGMSNLGMRIIYGLLNTIPDVACERFFSCGIDMEEKLRAGLGEYLSLESKKRLKDFDMIGFSLGHELTYTNVLNSLDLGGLPLQSRKRDHTYPLVIAGGPCVLNPEPMHEFFDFFVIGEGEQVLVEIVDLYRSHKDKFKSAKISKQEFLALFSHIAGVYVPSLYEVTYNGEGKIDSFKPTVSGVPSKIQKRYLKDLGSAFFPTAWLVPYIQIVHDRITLELMRGCPNQCRFCQAKVQYFPFRQRDWQHVLDLARRAYQASGYEEIALGGLSVSDYADIEQLIRSLIDMFKVRGVSVSLPSIKPKKMLGSLSSLIATIKKSGLTFAPEAATEKLRIILGKDFDMQGFLQSVKQAYMSGYQHVKLYFMIGLPQEEKEDLDGIIDFSETVSALRKEAGRGPAEVNISINALIPKPHTPLQWLAMYDREAVQEKQDYLKGRARNKRLKFSFHNRDMSFLEGVLSRGDRRLSEVILAAFREGARFDAWENYFVFDRWLTAFRDSGIDPRFYLQAKSEDEILPWDFLDIGIGKERLLQEFRQVIAVP